MRPFQLAGTVAALAQRGAGGMHTKLLHGDGTRVHAR
jgi:hypothetical protein